MDDRPLLADSSPPSIMRYNDGCWPIPDGRKFADEGTNNVEMMPGDKELFRRVDEIVHYVWDPIGISGSPHARDECSSYLTAIYGRVKAGDIDAIVEYMKWVSGDHMGLIFDEEKARKAAERMLEWKDFIENPE